MDQEYLGDFVQLESGRHSFEYADEWLEKDTGLPLSLSMPLDIKRHEGHNVSNFFNGLLPDNDAVRKRWAKQFEVSYKNPHALLAHIGKDCPGAIQIVTDHPYTEFGYEPLTEADVEERLRTLREDETAWRKPSDKGQFSLAGAQRKTALFFDGSNWSVPTGRAATTHILKPPIPGFEAQEINECFCLWLSTSLNLITTECNVMQFGEESAIVITRFDRHTDENGLLRRIHMEDLCQASGVAPELKYQSDGGPNPEHILELLESTTSPDKDKLRFMEALFFNWLVIGTDAHAKNYSLLLGHGNEVILAPLYDISSYLPYTGDPRYENLAMKIVSKKKAGEVTGRYWKKLAIRAQMNVNNTLSSLESILNIFPNCVDEIQVKAISAGMNEKFVRRLSKQLKEWHQEASRLWKIK